MAISSGKYTVGGVPNADYQNWKDAFNAVDVTSVGLTGPLTFEQIADVTTESDVDFNFLTKGTNGHLFRITSNRHHGGDPNKAWKTTVKALTGAAFDVQEYHNVQIDNLYLKVEGSPSLGLIRLQANASKFPSEDVSWKIYNLLVDSGGIATTAIGVFDGSHGTQDFEYEFWNNKIFNTGYSVGQWGITFAQNPWTGTASGKIENNTIHGAGNGISAAGSITQDVNNNSVVGSHASAIAFAYGTSVTAKNNASDDDTADDAPTQSGNLINITDTDEFLSVTYSDRLMLFPKPGGQLVGGGVSPLISGNNKGLEGYPRGSSVSIGAHETSALPMTGVEVLYSIPILAKGTKQTFFTDSKIPKTSIPVQTAWNLERTKLKFKIKRDNMAAFENFVKAVENKKAPMILDIPGTQPFLRSTSANLVYLLSASRPIPHGQRYYRQDLTFQVAE